MRIIRTDEELTQQAFGDLVGVDQSTVSRLQSLGVLQSPLTAGAGIPAYCGRLREQAAARLGDTVGGLDLAQERAALAREQRMGIEIKNAALRGQYAPVALLSEVLAATSQAVAERFDHLPGQLHKACPDLPPGAVDQIITTVAAARNAWVIQTAELVIGQAISPEDDPDDDGEPEGAG